MRALCFVLAAAGSIAFLAATTAQGQIAPPRTLDELKTETQGRADRNAYPLTGLKPDDVREALSHINSLDRDEWAAAWSAIGDRYLAKAKVDEVAHHTPQARAAYRQAWRYYGFARWPVDNSPGKKKAYAKSLEAFADFGRLMEPPIEAVRIPFEGKEIVGYLRLPKDVKGAPIVLAISALDSRKEDNIERSDAYIKRGIAVLALDMPGTGQAPIKIDLGSERMFSTALDYLTSRPEIDGKRIVVQGGSWSGYWAAKLGVLERNRLRGVVAQGAPVHGYFQPEWQSKALGTREYLFDLFAARSSVYGVSSLEDFLAYGPRLSLKNDGLIDKPSAPMLLINGNHDTQVPIADLDLLLHSGSPKDAWVNPDGGHMGRSKDWPDGRIFEEITVPWVVRHLAVSAPTNGAKAQD